MNTEDLFIFLADDDEDDQKLFCEALSEVYPSIKINTFDNGVDLMAALLKLNKESPDIIFLDLNMPLMNGEECLDDIKNEPQLRNIPIVIYSGYIEKSKLEVLQNKGANRYLQKPYSYGELKSLLERCVQSIIFQNPEEDFSIK
ncbi:MAG: response regulator [Pricia sp.]|nr:response regulator [Pricia sp.]